MAFLPRGGGMSGPLRLGGVYGDNETIGRVSRAMRIR